MNSYPPEIDTVSVQGHLNTNNVQSRQSRFGDPEVIRLSMWFALYFYFHPFRQLCTKQRLKGITSSDLSRILCVRDVSREIPVDSHNAWYGASFVATTGDKAKEAQVNTASKRGTVTERSDLSVRKSKIRKVHCRIAMKGYKGVVIGSMVEWGLTVGDGREARWGTLFWWSAFFW